MSATHDSPEPSTATDRRRLAAAMKPRDVWWAQRVIGPLANRVVGLVGPYRAVTPNRVTIASLVVGIAAALAFSSGGPPGLQVGALLLQLSFLLDCVDGQLSRFRDESTLFGAVLDKLCDRLKLFVVAFGLASGLGRVTGDAGWFVPALVYLFSESMIEQYVNAYRKLEEGAALPPRVSAPPHSGLGLLRVLDLPIVRLGFADRYFLISAFTLVGASGACLYVLATLGVVQLCLRPFYYAFAFHARFGRWPWNDERSHRLGQNF